MQRPYVKSRGKPNLNMIKPLEYYSNESSINVPHLLPSEFNSDTTLSNYNHGKTVIFFYMPECGYCKQFKPAFLEAIQNSSDDINFVMVDITSPEGSKIQEIINTQPKPKYIIKKVPKLAAYLNGKFYGIYAPGDEQLFRTAEDVVLFAKDIGVYPVEKDSKYAM